MGLSYFAVILIIIGIGTLFFSPWRALFIFALAVVLSLIGLNKDDEEEEVSDVPPVQSERPKTVRTRTEGHKVAGTSFRQENIVALGKENSDYNKSKAELISDNRIDEQIWKYDFNTLSPRSVSLVPEPDNPQDKNAIKVIIDGMHVGYIKANSCTHVHNLLAKNAIERISCKITGGPYKCVSMEYDEDEGIDTYVLEEKDLNLSIHLDFTLKIEAYTSTATEKKTYNYVLVRSTMTFHKPQCRYARITQSSNKGYINSRSDAIYAGYSPCKYCKP